jgi:hypothetical protein
MAALGMGKRLDKTDNCRGWIKKLGSAILHAFLKHTSTRCGAR